MENESQENEQREKLNEIEDKVSSILEKLKEALKDLNIDKIVKDVSEVWSDRVKSKERIESEKINSQNKIHDINRRYFKMKFFKESIVVGIILISIIVLSCLEKIDNCTLGTLLGSIIGYSIGNFNSSNGPK